MNRRAALVAAALVAVAGAIPLWPQGLGGATTYAVIRGASMDPTLSRGDLSLVRGSRDYRVGDVAAYRNTSLHRVVVHRIAAFDGSTYTFKGDANSFVDPQQVSPGQIAGRVAVTVPYLGSVLLWLASPVNVLLLLLLGTLLVRELQRPRVSQPQRLSSRRVVPISDMTFPHELAIAEVPDRGSLLRLADRYDRPVLHDDVSGALFVVEGGMLFRSVPASPKLSVVEAPKPASRPGHRRPSPAGRDWRYG